MFHNYHCYDNNFVSIANIVLHHVLLPIVTTIKTSKLFKRYIDNSVFLSETKETTDHIKDHLNVRLKNKALILVLEKCQLKEMVTS